MNKRWHLSEVYKGTEIEKHFPSLDAVFACPGKLISRDPISAVKKVSIDNQCFYVKTYTSAGKLLRRYLGRSRAKTEWKNLMFFKSLNIPTAELVGYGEERKFGIFRRGALITKGIANSIDLLQYAESNPAMLKNRNWLSTVIKQVAQHTRKMHDVGFAHNDLNWRNILVNNSGEPKIYFIDCPSGRFWIPPLLKRRITKDLAHLDKVAREVLSKSSQLEFYKYYTGCKRLSRSDKKYIPIILNYHNKHREKKRQRLSNKQ